MRAGNCVFKFRLFEYVARAENHEESLKTVTTNSIALSQLYRTELH